MEKKMFQGREEASKATNSITHNPFGVLKYKISLSSGGISCFNSQITPLFDTFPSSRVGSSKKKKKK
ncbi:unnamed protein product, partial [Gulo gulo]